MKLILYLAALCALTNGVSAEAQAMSGMTAMPTPLAQLVEEAVANNPQIAAASDAWKASTHMAQQVTTLPDPQFMLEQVNMGSPKPFAGFSNSEMANIGFGVSQDIPYPGKLKLKGEAANRDAETQHAQAGAVQSSIAEQVKLVYLQLAYHDATLAILQENDAVLQPLIQSGISHYSVGQGSQADVLRSQLEHTKLLRETTMHHQEMELAQAELKRLLHRPQSSPDIGIEPMAASPLRYTEDELQALLAGHNPAVQVDAHAVQQQQAELKAVQIERKPDFTVGYQYQQTGSGYRNGYVMTLGMRLPRRKRVDAEVAQAAEMLNKSKHELDAQMQQQQAEVQKQYVTAVSTTKLLKEYQEGLLPQAEAAFHAEQSTYGSNTQQFAPVLASLLDLLTLEHDYHQTLLDHETALVHLETLTGAAIR
ncbi:MAG: TolC family protein [Acidobacteriaceae bacterium]|jgi:outer membrane protein TolC|nr:TolC family protein [Acidobacteriaceae bacterium]